MPSKLQAGLRAVLVAVAAAAATAFAGVSPEEAAHLKTDLTPFGAEKAGNKAGTIPAWTGGYTTPLQNYKDGGRRPDPFANEKPLFTVSARNMEQYADQLSEGVKALMKKYPDFRIDVYPTHRTAAAPQWVYDNTFKNATRARIVEGGAGPQPDGAYGGTPFPIPKSGVEAIYNHELRWSPPAAKLEKVRGYLVTSDGRRVLIREGTYDYQWPYYIKDGEGKYTGEYWLARGIYTGPPVRAGESIAARFNRDESRSNLWSYLPGQRRARKVPNPCCDTATPSSGGLANLDEAWVFSARTDRFDWKLVGKKEMYIPYNSNRTLVPTRDTDVLGEHFLNPDHVRWELHRVWVVEATLKPGRRHTSPRSRYYLDEDTWIAVLADRWDANGQLARMPIAIPVAVPDLPGQISLYWGIYDLISGTLFMDFMMNQSPSQIKLIAPLPDGGFTPDWLIGQGLR